MGLESGTYIDSLVATNPLLDDPVSQGDDHIRLLKSTILNSFPNIAGAMNASHTELNHVVGVTSGIQGQINGKEDDLGNPAADDYVLASTAAGVRVWRAGGASELDDLSDARTPGTGNYGIGPTALDSWSSGSYNIAIGDNSLTANSSGSNNTAVGAESLNTVTTSNNNTALGYQSLYNHGTGANNTAVGYQAAYDKLSGANCTVIGANAEPSSTGVSNEVTIGDTAITRFRVPALNFDVDTQGIEIQPQGAYDPGLRVKNNGDAASWARFNLTNDQAPGTTGIFYVDQNGTLGLRNDAGGDLVITVDESDLYANSSIDFKVDGTTHMRLDENGSLLWRVNDLNYNAYLGANGSNPAIYFDSNDSLVYNKTNNWLQFYINNNQILNLGTADMNLTGAGCVYKEQGTAISPIGQHTMWIPAGAIVPEETGGPVTGTVEYATNDINLDYLDFDASTDEDAQFTVQMPKGWNEGAVIFQCVWTDADTAGTGNVRWQVSGLALGDNDAIDAAFGATATVIDTFIATGDLHATGEGTVTIGGTPAAEDVVVFRVRRNGSNGGDTYTQDARLLGVRLHYTTDAATDD